MEQIINTSSRFSEKEREYHAYQARQNFLREQLTIQYELNELRQATLEAEKREQAALAATQVILAETKTILAEIERLKVLLTKQRQFLAHNNHE